MKLIHIGDLHLGKTFHKISIIEDQRYVLDQIVGLMKEQKANIVIAGDVFDSANPSLEAQELFLEFVKQVRTVCNNLKVTFKILIKTVFTYITFQNNSKVIKTELVL